MRKLLWMVGLGLLCLLSWREGIAAPAKARLVKAPEIALRDVRGVLHKPLARRDRATVLFFIAHDCPIANGYAPEINRIVAEFRQKTDFYIVHCDATLSVEKARRHAADYNFRVPVLLDSAHRLARVSGATMTPETVVYAPGARLIYRGRIDDKMVAYGKARRGPVRRDLRDVLMALSKGKMRDKPIFTPAIGCFIPFA